jgi:hypothetical protein
MSATPTPSRQITDHALIRYLERAYGLGDLIAAAKREMERGVEPAIDFGADVVLIHGCRMILIEGRVVTVLPKGKGRRRAHRRELVVNGSEKGLIE